ncbi:MAG: site-specific DNA-methyltransferase, partial [Cellulomonadaceae bacterium]|nr:site-specific DNA-methyltransferase [Cellulomonadaceae bacterium]
MESAEDMELASASLEVTRATLAVQGHEAHLHLGDAIEGMRELPDNSFDLAIIDPPYGASTSANWTLPAGHGISGFGGEWAITSQQWDMLSGLESFTMTVSYLAEVKRLVKPTGSLFIHSTYHNSGIANVVCQLLGIEILNEIIWYKRNAFPNLANRRLTASHETIHWAHTGTAKSRKYRFNADEVKLASWDSDSLKIAGKQMRTVWDIPNNKQSGELADGKHPTQKPLSVASRLLLMAGTPGGNLLIPFAGSGTEMVAGLQYGMNVTGFELETEYYDLALRRLDRECA